MGLLTKLFLEILPDGLVFLCTDYLRYGFEGILGMGRRVKEGVLDSNKEINVGGVIVSPSTFASSFSSSIDQFETT